MNILRTILNRQNTNLIEIFHLVNHTEKYKRSWNMLYSLKITSIYDSTTKMDKNVHTFVKNYNIFEKK